MVAAVGGPAPVLLDSEIRCGVDVLIALALGAQAVLLGRSWIYGLGLAGECGVEHVLCVVLGVFSTSGSRWPAASTRLIWMNTASSGVDMAPVDDRSSAVLDGGHPLARHIADFLTDLRNANKSGQTIRAYRGDLAQFAGHHDVKLSELDARPVRAYLADIAELAPSSRKRKRPQLPRSASGRFATTCAIRTRWTRSIASRCRRPCPARPITTT